MSGRSTPPPAQRALFGLLVGQHLVCPAGHPGRCAGTATAPSPLAAGVLAAALPTSGRDTEDPAAGRMARSRTRQPSIRRRPGRGSRDRRPAVGRGQRCYIGDRACQHARDRGFPVRPWPPRHPVQFLQAHGVHVRPAGAVSPTPAPPATSTGHTRTDPLPTTGAVPVHPRGPGQPRRRRHPARDPLAGPGAPSRPACALAVAWTRPSSCPADLGEVHLTVTVRGHQVVLAITWTAGARGRRGPRRGLQRGCAPRGHQAHRRPGGRPRARRPPPCTANASGPTAPDPDHRADGDPAGPSWQQTDGRPRRLDRHRSRAARCTGNRPPA